MKPWIRGYERSQAALRLAEVERDPTLIRLHHEIAEDQTRRDAKATEVESSRRAAACESDGTCGSLQPGTLRIWQTKDEYYQISVGELKQLTADLNLKTKEFSDERIKLLAQVNSDTNTGQLDRSIVDDLASINALAAANSTKARTV